MANFVESTMDSLTDLGRGIVHGIEGPFNLVSESMGFGRLPHTQPGDSTMAKIGTGIGLAVDVAVGGALVSRGMRMLSKTATLTDDAFYGRFVVEGTADDICLPKLATLQDRSSINRFARIYNERSPAVAADNLRTFATTNWVTDTRAESMWERAAASIERNNDALLRRFSIGSERDTLDLRKLATLQDQTAIDRFARAYVWKNPDVAVRNMETIKTTGWIANTPAENMWRKAIEKLPSAS